MSGQASSTSGRTRTGTRGPSASRVRMASVWSWAGYRASMRWASRRDMPMLVSMRVVQPGPGCPSGPHTGLPGDWKVCTLLHRGRHAPCLEGTSALCQALKVNAGPACGGVALQPVMVGHMTGWESRCSLDRHCATPPASSKSHDSHYIPEDDFGSHN